MATLEQDADKLQKMTSAIMTAISRSEDCENIQIIMGSLGAVAGCMAQASGRPDEFLGVLTKMAQGIVSGDLLD